MPLLVVDKRNKNRALEIAPAKASLGELEVVARNCKLEDTSNIILKNIKPFQISSEIIAYASPESTYAVTKRLLDAAQKSVLIGIYDFTAAYIRDILLNLMARGVKVSLMLDLDGVKGEYELFKKLGSLGAEVVPAPSCASERANYFSSSHEKVIVIDDQWVLVQSGNYSNNSIPLNESDGGDPDNFVKGNRDMGVAIKSKPLAAFFAKVLRADMALELAGVESVTQPPVEIPMLVEAAPKLIPEKLFKSKSFNPSYPVKVQPILSPDNYMDVIPDFLRSAKKSIFIEQQYIRSKQPEIAKLIDAMKDAIDANPDLDVRIILGKIFDKKDVPKEKANLDNIKKKIGLKLGPNIRFINTQRFVHCHNKLIVIDHKSVLVSSQNWSDSAVSKNREAGVILNFPQAAKYFADIFESDWASAVKVLPKVTSGEIELVDVMKGGYIEVSPGDYAEV